MDYIVEPQMLTQGVSHLDDSSLYETGSGHYGCSHNRRRCRIIAPCCNEIFDCRHCLNESSFSQRTFEYNTSSVFSRRNDPEQTGPSEGNEAEVGVIEIGGEVGISGREGRRRRRRIIESMGRTKARRDHRGHELDHKK